jgi:hypothetical protein
MRKSRSFPLLVLVAAGLVACSAPGGLDPIDPSVTSVPPARALPASEALKSLSCPTGAQFVAPTPLSIDAESVALSDRSGVSLPPGVRFAGGWALTSANENFGGLSGIELLADGNFLTVSDSGAFVWIDRDAGELTGTGRISYMRGADNGFLRGKTEGDAEGLAMKDGVAYVSFERRHRIEAFDLANCGSAARAAIVAALPGEIDGAQIRENSGAEALSSGKTLRAGYEQLIDGKSPLVDLTERGTETMLRDPLNTDFDSPLVGMTNRIALGDRETAGTVVYSLRRNYNPVFGNRLAVEAEYQDAGGSSRRGLFTLSPPMNVDNFEGITVETLHDGTHRLWIVSDDNFSDRQRTLLFAFDLMGEAH